MCTYILHLSGERLIFAFCFFVLESFWPSLDAKCGCTYKVTDYLIINLYFQEIFSTIFSNSRMEKNLIKTHTFKVTEKYVWEIKCNSISKTLWPHCEYGLMLSWVANYFPIPKGGLISEIFSLWLQSHKKWVKN